MSSKDGSGLLFPFSSKMEILINKPAYSIEPEQSLAQAAKLMKDHAIDALVVRSHDHSHGMVTQTDLVHKALTRRMDPDTPVRQIMSSNIISIDKEEPLFDGLMKMVNHGIRHLLVLDGEQIAGVVSEHDWITFQRRHPVIAIHDIKKAKTIEEVARLKNRIAGLAQKIFEKEGNATSLITLYTQINDRVTNRIAELCLDQMKKENQGSPPVPFAWIGMGSEGRMAQTIYTDQDNGIIFENVDADEEPAVKQWFLSFAEKVVDGLEYCGFKRCKGNIMATNPKLCNSLDTWKKTFANMIHTVESSTLLAASIYFDFRYLFGTTDLVDDLWRYLLKKISVNRNFLRFMARNMMISSRPPTHGFRWMMQSIFNTSPPPINLKREALSPLVDAARILSLRNGSSKTNTLERLDSISDENELNQQTIAAAKDAYDFIMLLRLRHDFRLTKMGMNPDIKFKPKTLNPLQLDFFRHALISVSRIQSDTFSLVNGVEF